MTKPRRTRSPLTTFAWPLTIGACSLIGLAAGLSGDGWRDIAAVFLLGIPILAVGTSFWRARKTESHSNQSRT